MLSILLFIAQAAAQTYVSGTFTGAIYVTGLSNAVQVQCPADHPQRCDAIQQPNYCCVSGSYCAVVSGAVGCCPSGQTCTSMPTTTAQPTVIPATVVVTTSVTGFVVPSGYVTTTTVYTTGPPNGQPCTTLTQNGAGLPTTRAGLCGTIVIVSEGEKVIPALWLTSILVLMSFVLVL